MDDRTRRAFAGPHADDAPELPMQERKALTAKLDDLGKRLVLDAHRFWSVPDGWTEAELRDLGGRLDLPLALMAHLAVTTARGLEPVDPTTRHAGVTRFDFEARVESAELRRVRKAEHAAGNIAKAIHCRGRGCRRLLARPRPNPDAAGGVDLVLIGPVHHDPGTGLYIFEPGHPSRAADIFLHGVGNGPVDERWQEIVRCSCGHPETLFVGLVLREFARSV